VPLATQPRWLGTGFVSRPRPLTLSSYATLGSRISTIALTGREVRRRPHKEGRVFMKGRVFMVEQSDLLASLGYHRAGDLSLRSWLSSLQGTPRELAWFARDDLASRSS
jgi:hypothetical protein